jgi:hypothetical protein
MVAEIRENLPPGVEQEQLQEKEGFSGDAYKIKMELANTTNDPDLDTQSRIDALKDISLEILQDLDFSDDELKNSKTNFDGSLAIERGKENFVKDVIEELDKASKLYGEDELQDENGQVKETVQGVIDSAKRLLSRWEGAMDNKIKEQKEKNEAKEQGIRRHMEDVKFESRAKKREREKTEKEVESLHIAINLMGHVNEGEKLLEELKKEEGNKIFLIEEYLKKVNKTTANFNKLDMSEEKNADSYIGSAEEIFDILGEAKEKVGRGELVNIDDTMQIIDEFLIDNEDRIKKAS